MLQTDATNPHSYNRADSFERGRELRTRLANPHGYHEEILPFTVRLVHDDADLNKAVQIRHSAYARHLPKFAETLKIPEREDTENGVTVLLAESKLDGSPLGTMRIQTNQFKPLCVEQSIELPQWLKGKRLAEATRLGVTDGKGGRLVTTVLFKAFYLYCNQIDTEWMVVTGRSPIDRQYDRMLFEDVFPGIGYIPLAHVGNLPHRVMASKVDTVEARWVEAKHPLLDFVVRTHHPDIKVTERRRALLPPQNFTIQSKPPVQNTSYPM
jgi:hypothetical protein